ncbi:T9SS type A sorting domain-containing protein [Flavobacterium magnum]|nr:T9SS type A sorting domain-containing protein [Flavobacterium magnum]
MGRFIMFGFLWMFPLSAAAQTAFYVGEEIYIGSGGTLYCANSEVKFNANIVTETAPKGVLVFGENTSYSGADDAHKVVGFLANNFPADLVVYPVGSLLTLKPFELQTASNDAPVEIGFIAAAPENPGNLEGVGELADSGYWAIHSEALGKVKLYFTAEDLASLSVSDFADFSIAGYDGSDWVVIPSTVNEAGSYVQSNDFIDQALYSSYTFAVAAPLNTPDPAGVIDIVSYRQRGSIFIRSESASIQQVILYDMRGREVYRKWGSGLQLELNDLNTAGGVYVIVVETDRGSVTRKIVY